MRFSVGDEVVHPHRGPGRIVDLERKELTGEEKRYYVIEISFEEMTVHVPVGRVDEVGLRPAMPRARVTRVLDALSSKPHQLAKNYKERQETVREKLATGRPVPTAEAVRDLTWHGQHANLTQKDSELLQRGQDLLAAEMALVSDIGFSEANERIESALAVATAKAE
jgi:CarD family transcriptional regulator